MIKPRIKLRSRPRVTKTDSEIIDALGGTTAVAKLCEVAAPSVSEWRRTGIPRARRMYLRLIRPDAFAHTTTLVHPPQDRAA